MKRKIFALFLVTILCFSFTACGGSESSNSASASKVEDVPNLEGTWKQVNSESDTTYHEATISGNEIIINWIDTEGETESLYWAGSFVSPTSTDQPYTWESENDTSKTDTALLASGDATKTFTYEDGQIVYKASALGTTKTIRLEKEE